MKDVDFWCGGNMVREGNDNEERVTMLPVSAADELQTHLILVKASHERALAENYGEVYLPYTMACQWGWHQDQRLAFPTPRKE